MRRQEKLSAPEEEHDPHRLVVSRRVILRGATPSLPGVAFNGDLDVAQSLLDQKVADPARHEGASAFTQSKGVLAWPPARRLRSQTPRRVAGQWVIRCTVPRNGTNPPGLRGIFSGSWRSFAPIQAACRFAKAFASPRLPRAGIVKTTSCVAARTRKVKRRAEAMRRKLIR